MKCSRLLHTACICSVLWLTTTPVVAGPPKPATEVQIAEQVRSTGDAIAYPDADTVTVLDETDVYVRDNGLARKEVCEVIKILTPAGVKSQSVQRFEYDPVSNRIAIRSIKVHRKDGRVDSVPIKHWAEQPAKQWMIYWRNRQFLMSIPNLQVGDAIEIRTSRIGYNVAYLADDASGSYRTPLELDDSGLIPPMEGHWHEVMMFQTHHPIRYKRFTAHMPKHMPLQYAVYNGSVQSSLWLENEHKIYSFEAKDIKPLHREPHTIADSDVGTKVVLATVPDWESKSRWFHDANKYQFDVDATIKEKVAEITEGITDEEQKIRACLNWVADNIRYCGTSRGPKEGYTLHTGIETLRDRHGVCKDKAGIMVTFLRALGFESYSAMTMAGSRIEEVPADQFNHCVTIMRNDDGSFRILDPTWVPLSREIWSSREALQGIVYGTPDGEPLMLTPYYAPEYNSYRCTATSTLTTTGDLQCDLHMEMTGYPDTYFRRNLDQHPSKRAHLIEENLNIAPNAEISDLHYTDPRDYSADATLDAQLLAKSYASGDGTVLAVRLPLMRHPLKSFLMPDLHYDLKEDSRRYPMRLRATRKVQYEETLQLPDGWTLAEKLEPIEMDTPSASLTFTPHVDGNVLHYSFELTAKNHIVPSEDYAQYKNVIQQMNELSNRWILLHNPAEFVAQETQKKKLGAL